MADHGEASPLLGHAPEPGQRHPHDTHDGSPLLSTEQSTSQYGSITEDTRASSDESRPATATSQRPSSHHSASGAKSRRIPTLLAIAVLSLVTLGIICGVYFAPTVVEEYAKQALVLEASNLSIDSIDGDGVVARIQGKVVLNATRVERDNVRNIGRLGTWIAGSIRSEPAEVKVHLPHYDNLLLGTASIPAVHINIRNGHVNNIDMLARLKPGNVEGIRQVANDWLEGRLDRVRITGRSHITLKSGLIPLGTQDVVESFVLEGNEIPSIPTYNITRLNFREAGGHGMLAEASISVDNGYPIDIAIPSLNFDILVPGCSAQEPFILVANATTLKLEIHPYSAVRIDVHGLTEELPETLTSTCPNSDSSPLDVLLRSYLHGNEASLLVRGSKRSAPDVPTWMSQLLASMTVPVPFPRGNFDSLLRNFSLTDAHFDLPDPFAEPDTDEANPRISGNILVIAGLPSELSLDIGVTRVRAHANVTYKNKQMGVLNLAKWQPAESRRLEYEGDQGSEMEIKSRINNAPLNITDDDVFTDVLQRLIFDRKPVILRVDALVEMEVETSLGKFQIKDLPAQGNIPVNPIATPGGFDDLGLRVSELRIVDTSQGSISLQARVDFTNPSEYTAYVPYFEIDVLSNGSTLGQTKVRDVRISRGENHGITIDAHWDPRGFGGKDGVVIGRRLLSEYVSGKNTSLTLRTSSRSIPHQPGLGEALARFPVEMPTPRIHTPGRKDDDDDDDNDGRPHFISSATFHLFSSTGQFTLASPLQYSTLIIDRINATAYYHHGGGGGSRRSSLHTNHDIIRNDEDLADADTDDNDTGADEPIGHVDYWIPFHVPPGISESPRIPVDWSLDSVGYEKMRRALGGTLKLAARGQVDVRLGRWAETIEYDGEGIGARVRL